jgi:hypothetical protein
MFWQKLFASMKARWQGSSEQPTEGKEAELPKQWKDLLDAARPERVETLPKPVAGTNEARRPGTKTGT